MRTNTKETTLKIMNKPKYKTGDQLSNTDIYVRGIAILSSGQSLYFLQIHDNTFVMNDDDIEYLEAPVCILKLDKSPIN